MSNKKVLTGTPNAFPVHGSFIAGDVLTDPLGAVLPTGAGVSLSKITVMPTNVSAFPSYGVQTFTDLNDAWASIPRTDFSYKQICNDWIVYIPPGTYTPASNNIAIKGITVNGSNRILDWGYSYGCIQLNGNTTLNNPTITSLANINGLSVGMLVTGPNIPANTYILSFPGTTSVTLTQNATATASAQPFIFADVNKANINQIVTGPGLASGTTIQALGFTAGYYQGSGVTFTQGSNIITGITSTSTLFVGQMVYSGGSAAYLPYTYITAILGLNSVQVAIPATASGSTSLSGVASFYAQVSNNATSDNRNVNYTVNIPLRITGTTNGTSTVSNCNYVCNAMIGKVLTGADIPVGTTITAVSYNSTTNLGTLTLSQAATGSTTNEVLSLQIPNMFFCEMVGKRISNITLGTVNIGDCSTATAATAFAWSPEAGIDHFIDLYIQPGFHATVFTTRHVFHWQSVVNHSEANTTHDSYASKGKLSGSIRVLDPISGGSPQQHFVLGDLEVFGNPIYTINSVQTGTTTLGSTTISALTSTAGLILGQAVSGSGIPTDTYIQTITDATSLVISKPATASASPSLTFAWGGTPQGSNSSSVLSVDFSLCSTVTYYLSLYKVRLRGILNGRNTQGLTSPAYRIELANIEHVEFSGYVGVIAYNHVQNTAFKAGMYWNAVDSAFDCYGMTSSQAYSTAAFNSAGSSVPLRVDSYTNYTMKMAGTIIGSTTPKLIFGDHTTASAALTAQTASIGSTTIFTPASDGIYQISVYTSTTTAGSSGTEVTTIGWKDDTTTQSVSLAAIQLSTQGSYAQQMLVAKCKSGQPITYSTVVAGSGGSPQYALYVNVVNLT